MRLIQVSVQACKKIGTPNYGSVGASCELRIELDPDVPADRQIQAAAALAAAAVDEHLARETGQGQPAGRPIVAPEPSAVPGVSVGFPRPAQPQAQPVAGSGPNLDQIAKPPNRAAQIYPWASKIQEAGYPGLINHLTDWGRKVGLTGVFKEWPDAQVGQVVAEARAWAAAVQR